MEPLASSFVSCVKLMRITYNYIFLALPRSEIIKVCFKERDLSTVDKLLTKLAFEARAAPILASVSCIGIGLILAFFGGIGIGKICYTSTN